MLSDAFDPNSISKIAFEVCRGILETSKAAKRCAPSCRRDMGSHNPPRKVSRLFLEAVCLL